MGIFFFRAAMRGFDLGAAEQMLVDRYTVIEDRHERLSAIVARTWDERNLPVEERLEDFLVAGCQSRVWLKVAATDGLLVVRFATESALLRGIIGLFVELYDGASCLEATTFSPRLLEALGLEKTLSPTRLRGLSAVVDRLRECSRLLADVDRRS